MSYYYDDDGSDEEAVRFANGILFVVIVGLAGIVGVCVVLQWMFPR